MTPQEKALAAYAKNNPGTVDTGEVTEGFYAATKDTKARNGSMGSADAVADLTSGSIVKVVEVDGNWGRVAIDDGGDPELEAWVTVALWLYTSICTPARDSQGVS